MPALHQPIATRFRSEARKPTKALRHPIGQWTGTWTRSNLLGATEGSVIGAGLFNT